MGSHGFPWAWAPCTDLPRPSRAHASGQPKSPCRPGKQPQNVILVSFNFRNSSDGRNFARVYDVYEPSAAMSIISSSFQNRLRADGPQIHNPPVVEARAKRSAAAWEHKWPAWSSLPTGSLTWEWKFSLYIYTYIWSRPPSLHPPPPPPHGLGPQVAAPIPFYLQAIGSISEVQLRIC